MNRCYPLHPCGNPSILYPTYHYFVHSNTYPVRVLPEVDSTLFEKSATKMNLLMKDASLILNKLSSSKEFANKIMYEAQQSNTQEVQRLLKSTGIQSNVDVNYNPDGITLKFSSMIGTTECCHLTVALRWL
ncbi:hypothetical protein ACNRWW_11635 [Metabacillus sp. HB246100]|uniref:hypothetical protein n=1 Tax=Bacillus weihaiensis TaxID=1547283 RepID=UPI00235410F5|nr:hypothetical protein [Bacillus weihaiensis]